jgi:hypothetical protein
VVFFQGGAGEEEEARPAGSIPRAVCPGQAIGRFGTELGGFWAGRGCAGWRIASRICEACGAIDWWRGVWYSPLWRVDCPGSGSRCRHRGAGGAVGLGVVCGLAGGGHNAVVQLRGSFLRFAQSSQHFECIPASFCG